MMMRETGPQQGGPNRSDTNADARDRLAPAGPRRRDGSVRGFEPIDAEDEFSAAIRECQRGNGRMFPTWSEVLEVARGLGCRKPEGGDGHR